MLLANDSKPLLLKDSGRRDRNILNERFGGLEQARLARVNGNQSELFRTENDPAEEQAARAR